MNYLYYKSIKSNNLIAYEFFYKITPSNLSLYKYCRVTVCSPNPEELSYKPNEPNTINL